MKILVTGGTGYIGSHTCVELLQNGFDVVIADNLSNSTRDVLPIIEKLGLENAGRGKLYFYEVDMTCEEDAEKIFLEHDIDGIIHFAGFKAVGESVEKPLEYYYNNLLSTMVVARLMKKYDVKNLVFSSSAIVYGDNDVPFREDMPLKEASSPYGKTKAICETILKDFATSMSGKVGVALLRYFNPVGAHESGTLGEAPNGIPNNLMPYIQDVAIGKREKLFIFGGDYDTRDGSCVRDYLHVMDLAEGHVVALKNLLDQKEGARSCDAYNLGTGTGTSVLEIVHAFERANGIKIPYEIVGRRAGDLPSYYASVDKIKNELGWSAKRDLVQMCKDAYRFACSNNDLVTK